MQILTLYDAADSSDSFLTFELKRLYAGDLSFPVPHSGRPYVIGNFVETIDGVVSYNIPGRSGGAEISGGSAEDRFIMGLLRSVCDAVLIGSGTLHGDPGHVRIPEFVYPEAKHLYAELRRKLGKPPLPLNVVLTASGRINLEEPTFHTPGLPVLIVTTEEGASRLARHIPSEVAVWSTGETGSTRPEAVLNILADQFDVRLLLHEGGPLVFGQFLAAGAIDELFLTLAPQIAGRQRRVARPSIAGEMLFSPETAPWLELRSVKQSVNHLFLRYGSRHV